MGPLIFLAAAAATPNELLLICRGATVANVAQSQTTVSVYDNHGDSAVGHAVTTAPEAFSLDIQFRMIGDKAEINLPSAALPTMNSAKEGWLPVKELVVSGDQISGKVRYNFLHSTRFRIDRRTGIMTSSAGFQGACTKQEIGENRF